MYGRIRSGKPADGLDDFAGLFVVDADTRVRFFQFGCQSFVIRDHAAEREECADDHDAHLDCMRAIQDVRGHEGPVFGEGERSFPPAAATQT